MNFLTDLPQILTGEPRERSLIKIMILVGRL